MAMRGYCPHASPPSTSPSFKLKRPPSCKSRQCEKNGRREKRFPFPRCFADEKQQKTMRVYSSSTTTYKPLRDVRASICKAFQPTPQARYLCETEIRCKHAPSHLFGGRQSAACLRVRLVLRHTSQASSYNHRFCFAARIYYTRLHDKIPSHEQKRRSKGINRPCTQDQRQCCTWSEKRPCCCLALSVGR